MNKESEKKIVKIISDAIGLNSQNINSISKYRWDSLQHIKVIVALEKKLKIRVPTSIVHELTDLKKILLFLKKK
jgi:acyl carrier protein|tara:strand:- start:941 stop:1162 length:222 start_codon:yes stop_codon:yes gene_type:complete